MVMKRPKRKRVAIRFAKWYPRRIRVGETPYGLGVFAQKYFPRGTVIGRVFGEVIADPDYESCNCIDLGSDCVLEPAPPFQYLNHSCEPTVALVHEEEPARLRKATKPHNGQLPRIYVESVRPIEPGEQLTIDYAWPARAAIPCLCGSRRCRGWIVAPGELKYLRKRVLV